MPDPIQVLGLSTTNMHECMQYTLLTKTGTKYYDYIFTPSASQQYTLRINPTIDKVAKLLPIHQYELKWQGTTLMLIADQPLPLYNTITRTLTPPDTMFHQEVELRPKRIVMIINGNPDAVLPFLSSGLSKVYADRWEHLPAVIPEDVIILNSQNIPIQEIVLRLPQRTQALVITPQLSE